MKIKLKIEILIIILASIFFFIQSAGTQINDPLHFTKENYTIETKKVRTSAGEKTVTYHSYRHVLYVANPVDVKYESLDVSVPVKVDNKTIDATNAPILFYIAAGGWMSVNNAAGVFMGGMTGRNNSISGITDLALVAGYVLVVPGCRGRENKAADGTYYGKAPAAIVDLKAAVRYIHHNKGIIPGNTDRIISAGVSSGGAFSAILGASGNSKMFDVYLNEIGAADARDDVYASACFCPIIDLEHACGAYEWMYGTTLTKSGLVNQELSKQLKESFAKYQASLKLKGESSFGIITADNYSEYLIRNYLKPSLNKYLESLTDEKRKEYLSNNKWITPGSNGISFSFRDFVNHVGRSRDVPAFDDFDMRNPAPILFGNKTTNTRHYTDFSLQQSTGNRNAKIDDDLLMIVNMMNPMYFIMQNKNDCARHWWIRHGTSDNFTSLPVITNLAISLENRDKNVNTLLYWDAGHGANEDPEDLIAWIGNITGFKK